jgi:hypothetical protein
MDAISEAVFQALGEASMCWSERPTGVFDDVQASAIGKKLLEVIRANMIEVTRRGKTKPKADLANDDIDPVAIGHTCYYCPSPAESQCPTCHKFTCYEHRRDFPPDFDEHWCENCTGKHIAIMQATITK